MKNKIRILLVDDDDVLLSVISIQLGKHDFDITTASSGEEALNIFRESSFQLLITDIVMPGMSGIELLKEVKRINPETEVIIITSYASVENTISALRFGAYDYLIKPFKNHELVSVIVNRAAEKIRLTADKKILLDNLMAYKEELEYLNKVLHKRSICDGLTGLYNHQYFQEAGAKELAKSSRYERPLSLIFIDVDYFKEYNDQNGHIAGDDALKKIADLIKRRLRDSDIIARYGGEEFVALLPETTKEQALIIAETLREMIAAYPFPGSENQPKMTVSVSMGISGYPDDGNDLASLIREADNALYRAKDSGRNTICEAIDS